MSGFEQLAEAWLATLGGDRTRSAYRSDLDQFRGWLTSRGVDSPLAATSLDVQRFRDDCAAAGVADATIARRVSAMRSFFRFAHDAAAIPTTPVIASFGQVRVAGARVDLAAADFNVLLDTAKQLGSRTASLVGLMLCNGLRLGEVLACDAGDVGQRRRSTAITVQRRGGRAVIELEGWTAGAIRRYLGDRRHGPLLLGESAARPAVRLTRFGADYLIKRVGVVAGLAQPLSSNSLRRSFVARSHGDGMSIGEIRDRLGHHDARTTLRHITPSPPSS